MGERTSTITPVAAVFLAAMVSLAGACDPGPGDEDAAMGPDAGGTDGSVPLDGNVDAGLDAAVDAMVVPLPTEHPYIVLSYLDLVSADSAEFQRLQQRVDLAVGGDPDYGYAPAQSVIVYRVTGDTRYIDHAIAYEDERILGEEAVIAGGGLPDIAGNSYLRVGGAMESLALVYDYGYERLTPEQRERWSAYAEQAIWNIWNYEDAVWGGTAMPWSGWSVNSPGNNYFYSFTRATMFWGLASQSAQWLEFLRTVKYPLLVEHFSTMEGGGSREGTGYGETHRHLFSMYRVWEASTGERLATRSSHVADSIDYWIHATVPTMNAFAPIGDQARASQPNLYDYHEHLVNEATVLVAGTDQARRGTWWLNYNSVGPVESRDNARRDLLPRTDTPLAPTALVHHAVGAGHFFARTSWMPSALWMSFVAGTFDESHAHREQGGFSLYQNEWLAVTENIWTRSGIQQNGDVHNVMRFSSGGAPIEQTYGDASMTYTTESGGVQITADLSGVYADTDRVSSWTRSLDFNEGSVRVHDTCTVATGVEPVWQLNVPVEPRSGATTGTIMAGQSIVAGALTITPTAPASMRWNVVEWASVDGSEFLSGWKIELRGGCDITVDLTVAP